MTAGQPDVGGGEAVRSAPEPLSVRIPDAVRLTGISRSRLYVLIQQGELETVKIGRSTLIPYRALRELVRG